MTLPRKHWFVVADGAKAMIFERVGRHGGLEAIKRLSSEEARQHTRDLVSDRPGRQTAEGGTGRHGVSGRTDPHQHAEEEFVRSVAAFVGDAARTPSFDHLVLIAPPRALGWLRSHLPKHAREAVSQEIEKDLVHMTDAEIAAHIRELDIA